MIGDEEPVAVYTGERRDSPPVPTEKRMDTETSRDSIIDARDVQTRDDLARYLSRSLPGDYQAVDDDSEVRNKTTFVKSYLIEAHANGDVPVAQRLAPAFASISELRDRSLLRATDFMNTTYFIDLGHPRFQVLHSIGEADKTDAAFGRLTEGRGTGFDHVWLPGHFLQEMRRGQLTGFKFRYKTDISGVLAIDPEDVDASTGEITVGVRRGSKFTMEVSEDATAEREYAKLVRQDVFHGRKALDQIQFRSATEDDPDDYIIDGVYSSGKVIGKGTSIGGHFLTVDGLIDAYARVIDRIEQEFAVGWVPAGDGYVLRGEPFVVWFPRDVVIDDLQAFADSLFRSSKPFRLFGVSHSASDRRIDIEAIDLHTGDPLSFELTPEWMRVYLPRGSCGNTIARLYTNLQHAMSSDVRLTVGGEVDPFAVGHP